MSSMEIIVMQEGTPYVFALQNGANLDHGSSRAKVFDAKCPDEGRVCIRGEIVGE